MMIVGGSIGDVIVVGQKMKWLTVVILGGVIGREEMLEQKS